MQAKRAGLPLQWGFFFSQRGLLHKPIQALLTDTTDVLCEPTATQATFRGTNDIQRAQNNHMRFLRPIIWLERQKHIFIFHIKSSYEDVSLPSQT